MCKGREGGREGGGRKGGAKDRHGHMYRQQDYHAHTHTRACTDTCKKVSSKLIRVLGNG